MAEQIKKIWKNITEFWGKLSSKNKKLIVGAALGLFITALVIALLLNKKEYVVLFDNIDKEETAEVMKQLQEDNVEYKYENDGTILIPKEQENTLRMQLAQSGHPRTGTNYDIFTQNIDFMTTDYEKRQYEIYQLQERLQDSIETIEGVDEAIVTLSLPEDDKFAWESDKKEPSASVKINTADGRTLTNPQINGILQLVVKSVEGLKEENVAIAGSDGESLKADGQVQQTDAIKLKLEIEKEFENDMKKNVTELLSRIYGEENVKVSAKCKINFDKKMSEMLQYTPDEETKKGVPESEENEREITGPGQTVGGVAGAEPNTEVPTYPGVEIQGDNIYFKDSNSIKYLVSQLKEQIEHNPGEIEQLTVAAVVNKTNMKTDELNNLKELVAFSTGIKTGDVSIQSMKFYDAALPAAAAIPGGMVAMKDLLFAGGIALAILGIAIFIASLIASRRRKQKEEEDRIRAAEEAKAREEEEARIRADEAARIKADAEARAAEEARIRAEVEDRIRAEEIVRIRAEEGDRIRDEVEDKVRAEEGDRIIAEEKARIRAEEEGRIKAEVEARIISEVEDGIRSDVEARIRAEAEEEARAKAEEEARIRAEEEARIRAEEEARIRAEVQEAARIKAEEEAKAAEEARIRAEEEAKASAEREAAASGDSGEEDEGIKVQETEEQKMMRQFKEFSSTNPEIAAQLIRTWLKGEDE